MRHFTTDHLPELSPTESRLVYNGLDSAITLECLDKIRAEADEATIKTYQLAMALQEPVLAMNLRGVLIDGLKRQREIDRITKTIARLEANWQRIVAEGLGVQCNWASNKQVSALLYHTLDLPEQFFKRKSTVNRDALEKLLPYFYAAPVIRHILSLRDLTKKLNTIKMAVDPDGRLRTTFNVAGTETGRFSSYFSAFGTGGNLQNWEQSLREIVIADKGMKFAYIDLEQAESRVLGAYIWNLFKDGKYLDACESGIDVHTTVAKTCYPNWRQWTGDPKKDRALAEEKFYRHHSLRHLTKVLGHGSNYRGSPWTMSKHTKIPVKVIEEFQRVYFDTFPGIRRYHEWCVEELSLKGYSINLFGRRRWYMGRRDSDETAREFTANGPQSTVADALNHGLLALWRSGLKIEILLQCHDALLIQFPEELESSIVPAAAKLMEIPIQLNWGRTLVIPTDVKTGWNWAEVEEGPSGVIRNPDGLKKFRGSDDRIRQGGLLDRVVP